jgi:hypothetical protein
MNLARSLTSGSKMAFPQHPEQYNYSVFAFVAAYSIICVRTSSSSATRMHGMLQHGFCPT